MTEYIPYWNIIQNIPAQFRQTSLNPLPMEKLDINDGNGQSYGYIVYRKRLPINQGSILSMRGRPRDLLHVRPTCYHCTISKLETGCQKNLVL